MAGGVQIEQLSLPHNLRPTVRFLVHELGIHPDKVEKVIVAFPQVRLCSLPRSLLAPDSLPLPEFRG